MGVGIISIPKLITLLAKALVLVSQIVDFVIKTKKDREQLP